MRIECEISHADTGLPDYAQRSYPIAIPVDGATTLGEVLDELAVAAVLGDDEWTDEQGAAYDAAVEELRALNADNLESVFDERLELDNDIHEHSGVYAYFTVEFSGGAQS